ncbi:hydrolase [Enterococcus faecium]|nr:hydrolase [Enterococcus faecium]
MADSWFLAKLYSTKSKTGEAVFVWLSLLLDATQIFYNIFTLNFSV